jgi:hypothetical protein
MAQDDNEPNAGRGRSRKPRPHQLATDAGPLKLGRHGKRSQPQATFGPRQCHWTERYMPNDPALILSYKREG